MIMGKILSMSCLRLRCCWIFSCKTNRFRYCSILVCWRFFDWRYSKENDCSCMKSKTNNGFSPSTLFLFLSNRLTSTPCSFNAHLFSLQILLHPRTHNSYWYSSVDFLLRTTVFHWISRSVLFACLFFLLRVSSGAI